MLAADCCDRDLLSMGRSRGRRPFFVHDRQVEKILFFKRLTHPIVQSWSLLLWLPPCDLDAAALPAAVAGLPSLIVADEFRTSPAISVRPTTAEKTWFENPFRRLAMAFMVSIPFQAGDHGCFFPSGDALADLGSPVAWSSGLPCRAAVCCTCALVVCRRSRAWWR